MYKKQIEIFTQKRNGLDIGYRVTQMKRGDILTFTRWLSNRTKSEQQQWVENQWITTDICWW